MSSYFSLLMEKRLDEAEAYRIDSIPSKLIKFFSFTDDVKLNEDKFFALETQKLWFSTPKILNDPYEFQCMYVDRKKLQEHQYPDEAIDFFNDLVSKQSLDWALISLSGNSFDCLPMWAYYTNNYQGFCIEYDILKADAIYKVGYEPNRIPIASIVTNLYAEFEKMRENKQVSNSEVEFYATLLKQQFFLKHESWRHENEYRIIYPSYGKNGLLVDIASVGLKTSKIVAGLRCSDDHKERLSVISKALGCGDLAVSTISNEKYTLLEDLRNE